VRSPCQHPIATSARTRTLVEQLPTDGIAMWAESLTFTGWLPGDCAVVAVALGWCECSPWNHRVQGKGAGLLPTVGCAQYGALDRPRASDAVLARWWTRWVW
jgi:hypothetical protein